MKRAAVLALTALMATACSATTTGSPNAQTQTTPPPAFDSISISVTGGANPAVITYDFDNGLGGQTKTWQIAQTTPFTTQVSRPHGQHKIAIDASSMAKSGSYFNCSVTVNGSVVASDQETEAGAGAHCRYTSTP